MSSEFPLLIPVQDPVPFPDFQEGYLCGYIISVFLVYHPLFRKEKRQLASRMVDMIACFYTPHIRTVGAFYVLSDWLALK